jgi:hypothetical protein
MGAREEKKTHTSTSFPPSLPFSFSKKDKKKKEKKRKEKNRRSTRQKHKKRKM